MDALDVHKLGERFDVALCFGILHRVTDPIALLRALASVLTPRGGIVLETYGSRLPADIAAIEVHEPGDVYARDDLVYWGFPLEGLRRSRFTSLVTCTRAMTSSTGASRWRVCGDLDASSASTSSRSSISWRSTAIRGSSRCCEPRADRAAVAPFRPPTTSRPAHRTAPRVGRW